MDASRSFSDLRRRLAACHLRHEQELRALRVVYEARVRELEEETRRLRAALAAATAVMETTMEMVEQQGEEEEEDNMGGVERRQLQEGKEIFGEEKRIREDTGKEEEVEDGEGGRAGEVLARELKERIILGEEEERFGEFWGGKEILKERDPLKEKRRGGGERGWRVRDAGRREEKLLKESVVDGEEYFVKWFGEDRGKEITEEERVERELEMELIRVRGGRRREVVGRSFERELQRIAEEREGKEDDLARRRAWSVERINEEIFGKGSRRDLGQEVMKRKEIPRKDERRSESLTRGTSESKGTRLRVTRNGNIEITMTGEGLKGINETTGKGTIAVKGSRESPGRQITRREQEDRAKVDKSVLARFDKIIRVYR